jgi:hypothetical protein
VQQKARDRVGQRAQMPEDQARQALIERFTDAASSVMSQEADIFEQRKEEIEHALSMSDMLSAQQAGAHLMRLARAFS